MSQALGVIHARASYPPGLAAKGRGSQIYARPLPSSISFVHVESLTESMETDSFDRKKRSSTLRYVSAEPTRNLQKGINLLANVVRPRWTHTQHRPWSQSLEGQTARDA